MLNRTTIITYVVLITFSFLIFRLVTNNVTSQYQIFVQFTKDLKKNVPISISNDDIPTVRLVICAGTRFLQKYSKSEKRICTKRFLDS